LNEIIKEYKTFEESKVGIKLKQTIYVGFNKDGDRRPRGFTLINNETHPIHFNHIIEDYYYICNKIRNIFDRKGEISTINGPNNLLQIRTKASRSKFTKNYTPLIYEEHTLKDKHMAFYLRSNFGQQLFKPLEIVLN
jgi:hypothetical protein